MKRGNLGFRDGIYKDECKGHIRFFTIRRGAEEPELIRDQYYNNRDQRKLYIDRFLRDIENLKSKQKFYYQITPKL